MPRFQQTADDMDAQAQDEREGEGTPESMESDECSRSGESQTQTSGSGSETGCRSDDDPKPHTNFSIDSLLHRKIEALTGTGNGVEGRPLSFPMFPTFPHPYLAHLIQQHRQAALFARWPNIPTSLYQGVGVGGTETGSGGSVAGSEARLARPAPAGKNPPVKKYKCDMCGKAFSRSNTLITHKRIHTGEKPFKCEHCGRAFRQPGNLTRHRLTHTTVKPYICAQCGKAFNRASNLHTHMRTHSSYRPFLCPYCAKGFHQKIDMKIHIYTHTGDRPVRSGVQNPMAP